MASTTINATCACKTFNLTVSFPDSSLPYKRAICLCTSCRQVSGSCGNTYILLPASALPIDPTKYSLTPYSTSDELVRYFCSTCGAHIFVNRLEGDVWSLATGLWDRTEDVIEWTGSKWVEDSLDGGVSVWFKEIDDQGGEKRGLKRWKLPDRGEGEELVPEGTFTRLSSKANPASGENEKLKAECHCGGVKFYVTRPNEESKKVYSPFPDLMVPYNSGESAENPNHETWFLRSNNTKYFAGTCTCPSCRQSLGFEIQTWAFIPKCNIFQEDGRPLEYNLGTLKRYDSSDGVYREFCGRCGATVFFHCDVRPDLIDVSVGLFDPAEGARIEGWLEWCTDRVSFEEMAVSKALAGSLKAGLKEWNKV